MFNRYYDPATGQFLNRDPIEAITQQPYTYGEDDPVTNTDRSGLSTNGYCIGGGAAWGPGIFGQVCIVTSSTGQIGITGTVGGGGGSPNASIGGYSQVSNANDLNQLRGPFGYGGFGVGEGVSIGAGGFVGLDSCNQTIYGGEAGGGVGVRVPIPFEAHGGASVTGVHVFGGVPATALKVGLTVVQAGIQTVTAPIQLGKDAYDALTSWL